MQTSVAASLDAPDELLWAVAWSSEVDSGVNECGALAAASSWMVRLYYCFPTLLLPYVPSFKDGSLQIQRTVPNLQESYTQRPSVFQQWICLGAYIAILPWMAFPLVPFLPREPLLVIPACITFRQTGLPGFLLLASTCFFLSLGMQAKRAASEAFLKSVACGSHSSFLTSIVASRLSPSTHYALFASWIVHGSSMPPSQKDLELAKEFVRLRGTDILACPPSSTVASTMGLAPIQDNLFDLVIASGRCEFVHLWLQMGADSSLGGWSLKALKKVWAQDWEPQDAPPAGISHSLLDVLFRCLQKGFPPPRPLAGNIEDNRTFTYMYNYSRQHGHFESVLDSMISSGWDINASRGKLLATIAAQCDWSMFKTLIRNGLRAHNVQSLDSKGPLLSWEGPLMRNRLFWRHVLECESLFDEYMTSWSTKAISLWMGLSSKSVVFDAIVYTSRQQNRNPLELAFLLGNGRAVQQLSMNCGFGETCKFVTDLLCAYPRINLGWAWNQLYEVNPKQFSVFREKFVCDESKAATRSLTRLDVVSVWPEFAVLDKQVQNAFLPFFERNINLPNPVDSDLKLAILQSFTDGFRSADLHRLHTTLFTSINFTQPTMPFYKGESARRFDGSVYPIDMLKSGLKRIVSTVSCREADVAAPNSNERVAFERYYLELEIYLRLVVLELTASTEADTRSTTLIYMGFSGSFCTDKWKEMLHQVLCNLTGTVGSSLENGSVADHLYTLAATLRGMIAQELSQKHMRAAGASMALGTHFYHQYMFLMQEERAIYNGPQYTTEDKFCRSKLPSKANLAAEFDTIYTVDRLLSELTIHYRALSHVRDLVQDWVRDVLAEKWNDPPFSKWAESCNKMRIEGVFAHYDATLPNDSSEKERRQYLQDRLQRLSQILGAGAEEQNASIAVLQSCDGLSANDLVRGINGRYMSSRSDIKAIPPNAFLTEVRREELLDLARPEVLQYDIHPLVLLELLRFAGLVRYRASTVFYGSFRV